MTMLHIPGVANAWKRTTASPCGNYIFLIDLQNCCCACIHLSTITRTQYYLNGSGWSEISLESMHAISTTQLIIVGQHESTRQFCVILAEVDHHAHLITAKETHITNLVQRIWDMQLGHYLTTFFNGNKICLIKHTTNAINKNSKDVIEIFRCSVENDRLTEKTDISFKAPLGIWCLPFLDKDHFVLIDTTSRCARINVTTLTKKKAKTISCKSDTGSLPKGMMASTVAIYDNKAWLTTCETREVGRPFVLWSLDMQSWKWTEYPLVFPYGSHKPIKLRSLIITPTGTAFMHGNCLENKCPAGGHLFSFKISQLGQLGSGQEFDITPEGLKIPFQSLSSVEGPSAPPMDMDGEEEHYYATINRAQPQRNSTAAAKPSENDETENEVVRFRRPMSDAPPPIPAHRKTLTEQYRLALEMGFAEESLHRLIEKRECKPFDNIDDLITAYEAMKVAEQREELYGNFSPQPASGIQPTSFILEQTEAATSSESNDYQATKCIICWDAQASVLVLPCKHFSFCGGCAKKITKKCPKCQGKITDKIEGIFVG